MYRKIEEIEMFARWDIKNGALHLDPLLKLEGYSEQYIDEVKAKLEGFDYNPDLSNGGDVKNIERFLLSLKAYNYHRYQDVYVTIDCNGFMNQEEQGLVFTFDKDRMYLEDMKDWIKKMDFPLVKVTKEKN